MLNDVQDVKQRWSYIYHISYMLNVGRLILIKGYGGMLRTLIRLKRLCRKYRIPFRDLPEVLEEYIYEDNIGWSD